MKNATLPSPRNVFILGMDDLTDEHVLKVKNLQ